MSLSLWGIPMMFINREAAVLAAALIYLLLRFIVRFLFCGSSPTQLLKHESSLVITHEPEYSRKGRTGVPINLTIELKTHSPLCLAVAMMV